MASQKLEFLKKIDPSDVIAAMKKRYLKLLHWTLGNEKKTVIAAVVVFGLTVGTLPFLGTSIGHSI